MLINRKRNIYKLLITILSFESVIFVQYLLKNPNQDLSYSNSWISVLVFIVFYKMYEYTDLSKLERKSSLVLVCLSILYAMLLVPGVNLYHFNSINVSQLNTWIKVIGNIPLIFIIIIYAYNCLPKINETFSTDNKLKRFFDWRRSWLIIWLIIILCWFVVLLTTFPGNYSYDAGYQLQDYLNHKAINLHHPLAHTELLIFFVLRVGKDTLGSARQGLFIYTLVQVLWLSFAYSRMLEYLRKINLNYIFRLCILLLFCISPYFGIMSISATKNVPYTASFIILILWYLQRNMLLKRMNRLSYWLIFSCLALVNLVFENQGIYVILLALVVSAIYQKNIRKELLISCVVILLGGIIYNGPVTKSLHGYSLPKDRARESLSIPIMQLSSVASQKGKNITRHEVSEVRGYIPNYKIYVSTNCQALSDPLKGDFNSGKYLKDKKAFWILWAKLGQKNIVEYLNAFGKMTVGYWYPDTSYPDWRTWYKPYLEHADHTERKGDKYWYYIPITTPQVLEPLYEYYNQFNKSYHDQRVPVLSMINSIGFNVYILFFFAAWIIIFSKKRYVFLLVMTIGLWGTFLLGPVVLYRYAFSIVSVVPLCAGIMIAKSKDLMENKL